MSITPFVKSSAELKAYNFGNFKRDIIKSARKLAKNHFSAETAAPFYLNLHENCTEKNPKGNFFIVFGKIQRWKDYAKIKAKDAKELALRGYCFVTMENNTLILNLMGVQGKLRSKPNDIRKAGAAAISKAKLRFELVKGEFDENENLENRAESLPEVEDSGEDIDDSDLEGDASGADDAVAAADNETTTANPQIEQAAQKALDAIRQAFSFIQSTTNLETYAVQANNIKEAYKSWAALNQKHPRPASEQTSINETMAAVKARANELRMTKLENLIGKYEALADKPAQAKTEALKLQQQIESLIEVLNKAGIA